MNKLEKTFEKQLWDSCHQIILVTYMIIITNIRKMSLIQNQ